MKYMFYYLKCCCMKEETKFAYPIIEYHYKDPEIIDTQKNPLHMSLTEYYEYIIG